MTRLAIRLFERKKTHELALIRMAPLLVDDCPDCQKKRGSIGPAVGTGR